MNRLAAEANRRAEGYWLTSRLTPIAACAMGGGLIGTHDYTFESWRQPLGTAAVAAVAWLMERRYRARARWLNETEQWWEKLEEAPSILPFPRFNAFLWRWIPRLESRVRGWRVWGSR